MFGTSGVLLILSSVCLWYAFDRLRLRLWREGVTTLSMGLALAGLGAGLLWFSTTHPDFEFHRSQNGGTNPSCISSGIWSSPTCPRDRSLAETIATLPSDQHLVTTWLEAVTGGVLGLGLIVGVFWFAFRQPPSIRTDGRRVNSDVDNLLRNLRDDGHGGWQ